MADELRFHLDPICPWCFQTSRWVRHLERTGAVRVRWGVFSLELNALASADGGDAAPDLDAVASADPDGVQSSAMLRTVVALRAARGDAAAGAFYAAHGDLVHVRGEQGDPREIVDAALADAGLPVSVAEDALARPATWDEVVSEHLSLVRRHDAFGVPFLVLDGDDGPGVFGPVVSEPPASDTAAEDLWRHTAWMARNAEFAELKRAQRRDPDLESVRIWRENQRESPQ
jgi:predicted DsbA family dithiol-disulfide isomerase